MFQTTNFVDDFSKKVIKRMQNSIFGRLFLHQKFAHYTWASIFISLLNIFLLWLLIDIVGIPTVLSSILVIGCTFIFRYLLFDFLKIL